MAFDANVHVGADIIQGSTEIQDWGGKLLMEIIKEEIISFTHFFQS